LRGVSFALFNYRGYGKSEGEPSESALFRDALEIYDLIAARSAVDKQRIVAMGRSLGSGVAAFLASQRPVAAVC
jgi:pimeloyl-ACP methyl ester carboxylesterase